MMAINAGRTVNLHISHSWGGGLGKWVHDVARADTPSEHLALECVGTGNCYGIGHRLVSVRGRKTLWDWTLEDPIAEVRVTHRAYRHRLEEIIEKYQVEHLFVSCLAGHTLDVFDLGLPVTRIHHDFFPWCPAFYCFREKICRSCQQADLEACRNTAYPSPINMPGYYPPLRGRLLEEYRRPTIQHVVPSSSVSRQLCEIDERFRDLNFHVIEHGIDCEKKDLFGGATEGQRLRVGIFGLLAWQKGYEILRSHFERMRLVVDFVFFGSGEASSEFQERFRVKTVPKYEHSELEQLLRTHPIDIALFMSVVPETFSYTLSEVWAFGIPPVAHRIGAFADRIRADETGFLFDFENDGLIDELLRLDNSRSLIQRVARRCAKLPIRTTREMVLDYQALRRNSRADENPVTPDAHATEGFGSST
jgi:glycosyltransferase involved in cell wall biosynthesis